MAYPSSYGFSNEEGYNTDFTFEVDLSNNDTTKVYAVALHIYTEGPDAEELISMAHYNARKNRWLAYEKFNLRSLPSCVYVEPFYYKDVMGSRKRIDDTYSFLWEKEDGYMDEINNLNDSIQAVIDRGNEAIERGEPAPIDELRQLNAQLSKMLGVVNNNETLPDVPLDQIQADIERISQELDGLDEQLELMEKPFNQLGEVIEGLSVTTADGMTAESMEANGYTKSKLDNGSSIYVLCDDGGMNIVDLERNTRINLTGQVRQNGARKVSATKFDEMTGNIRVLKQNCDAIGYALSDVENKIKKKTEECKTEIKYLDKKIEA